MRVGEGGGGGGGRPDHLPWKLHKWRLRQHRCKSAEASVSQRCPQAAPALDCVNISCIQASTYGASWRQATRWPRTLRPAVSGMSEQAMRRSLRSRRMAHWPPLMRQGPGNVRAPAPGALPSSGAIDSTVDLFV